MGGQIGLESALDEGSTFWFAVPLAPAREPRCTTPAPKGPPRKVSRRGRRKRRTYHVLVADDNLVNRMVTCRLVESLGYRVSSVADGLEVLDALSQGTFDAVLMDCQMPELDGYQTTQRIRGMETEAHIPVIALTASAMKEDLERCMASGMNDYLSKPCRLPDLEAALERWLPGELTRPGQARGPAPTPEGR